MNNKSYITVQTTLYDLSSYYVKLYYIPIVHTMYCLLAICLNYYFYSFCSNPEIILQVNNKSINFYQEIKNYLQISTFCYWFGAGIGLLLALFIKEKINNGIEKQMDRTEALYLILTIFEIIAQVLIYWIYVGLWGANIYELNKGKISPNVEFLHLELFLFNLLGSIVSGFILVSIFSFVLLYLISLCAWALIFAFHKGFEICKSICLGIKITYKKIPNVNQIDKNTL